MVPQIAAVEALECASIHEASWLERNLLERSLPHWNRIRGGKEVVVRVVRAVAPDDFPELVARARRILDRDEAAVTRATQQLLDCRERAARNLAFELPGQITNEVAALAWAGGTQRVTAPVVNAEVQGWWGGTLLSLASTSWRAG